MNKGLGGGDVHGARSKTVHGWAKQSYIQPALLVIEDSLVANHLCYVNYSDSKLQSSYRPYIGVLGWAERRAIGSIVGST